MLRESAMTDQSPMKPGRAALELSERLVDDAIVAWDSGHNTGLCACYIDAIGELATIVRYGLSIKVVVIKNSTLGQIKWEQMMFLGNPEYECDLQPIDFAAVAEAMGIRGYRVMRPEDCGYVLDQALSQAGPALVEPSRSMLQS